jgi:hypothetical protein
VFDHYRRDGDSGGPLTTSGSPANNDKQLKHLERSKKQELRAYITVEARGINPWGAQRSKDLGPLRNS